MAETALLPETVLLAEAALRAETALLGLAKLWGVLEPRRRHSKSQAMSQTVCPVVGPSQIVSPVLRLSVVLSDCLLCLRLSVVSSDCPQMHQDAAAGRRAGRHQLHLYHQHLRGERAA